MKQSVGINVILYDMKPDRIVRIVRHSRAYDHQPSSPWVGVRETVLGVGDGIWGL
jgi:hypothetical protein